MSSDTNISSNTNNSLLYDYFYFNVLGGLFEGIGYTIASLLS